MQRYNEIDATIFFLYRKKSHCRKDLEATNTALECHATVFIQQFNRIKPQAYNIAKAQSKKFEQIKPRMFHDTRE